MAFRFKNALSAASWHAAIASRWLSTGVAPGDVAICTIHGNTPSYGGDFARRYAWPKLQIEQLRRHTARGYRVYAFGNQLMREHEEYLRGCPEVTYFSSKEVLNSTFEHVWPLRNWLGRIALRDHRILVHLDSDAFPVKDDWLAFTTQKLTRRCPVVAVKRVENGDQHSDRCFLVYSRGGFRRHAFDFSKVGVVDSGGGISDYLEKQNLEWYAMLRSNAFDYHPLIAGIYDDRIYHHAAGSRLPHFRCNHNAQNQQGHWQKEQAIHRILTRRIFDHTGDFLAELRGRHQPFDLASALKNEKQEAQ